MHGTRSRLLTILGAGLAAAVLLAAEPVELDKCAELRAPAEAMVGPLSAAPQRTREYYQDMSAVTCRYRSADGWLTVTFVANPDRGQFERMSALVPGSARVDGVGDVAFSIPPTPDQQPAGATIAAYQGGTQVDVEVASGSKTADQLSAELKELARTIASDDRLMHGTDKQPTENQHLQGGG